MLLPSTTVLVGGIVLFYLRLALLACKYPIMVFHCFNAIQYFSPVRAKMTGFWVTLACFLFQCDTPPNFCIEVNSVNVSGITDKRLWVNK